MLRRLTILTAAIAAALLHPPTAAAQIQGVDAMFVRGAYSITFSLPRCPCGASRDSVRTDTAAVAFDTTHQQKALSSYSDTARLSLDSCSARRRAAYLLRVVGYHRSAATRGDFTGTLTVFAVRDTAGVIVLDSLSLPVTGQIEVAATGPLPRRSAWLRFTIGGTAVRRPRDIYDAALAVRRGAGEFTGSFTPLPLGGAAAAGTLVWHQAVLGDPVEQPLPLSGCGGDVVAALRQRF